MAKLNVSLDEDVKADLLHLVPPRKRSRVVNEALRKELLRRKRELAADQLRNLRRKSATLSATEIRDAVRKERTWRIR